MQVLCLDAPCQYIMKAINVQAADSENENSRLPQDAELPRSPKHSPVPHRLTGSPDKFLKGFV